MATVPAGDRARLFHLHRTLRREAHVLADEPGLLPSHLYNMLSLDRDAAITDSRLLEAARSAADTRPWLRLSNDPSVDRHVLLDVLKHGATVWGIAWSPRGDRLASAGSDGAVRIWDTETGINFLRASPCAGQANAVAWSPDGALMASGHDDSKVRIWDARTLEPLASLEIVTPGVLKLAWSPDGDFLAAAGARGPVVLVEWARRDIRRIGKHDGEVYALSWSRNGSILATGGADAMVRLWERQSGFALRAMLVDRTLLRRLSELLPGDDDLSAVVFQAAVLSLAWSPDGSILASGSRCGKLRLWDPLGGKPGDLISGDWSNGAGVWSLAWSKDGLLALGVGAGQIVLGDPMRRQQAQLPVGHADAVRDLAFGPDGHTLASCGDDGTVRLWTARALWERAPSMVDPARGGHGARLTRIVWSDDGRFLYAADHNCSASAWDADSGRRLGRIERLGGPVLAMAPGGRGVLFAACGSPGDTQVSYWEGLEAEPASRVTVQGPVSALAMSPDRRILASGDMAGTIWLTKLNDGSTYRAFTIEMALGKRPEGLIPVWGLAWSPDGKFVAAGGRMGLIVWNVQGPEAPQTVLLRPVQGSDDLEASSQAVLGSTVQGIAFEDHPVAWSPDGALLASGSDDSVIRLWRPMTGELVAVLEEHRQTVTALGWSRDGTLLASAGHDATVRVWDVHNRRRVALAHCLSPVLSVLFACGDRIVQAADNGAATGLRPLPYVFDLQIGGGDQSVDCPDGRFRLSSRR